MKEWRQLSPEAKTAAAALGNIGPTIDPSKREVKGFDGEGKFYLDANDLRDMATGLNEIADWLDERAAEPQSPAREEK